MVKTEFYRKREDGVILVRTYSTEGYYIRKRDMEYEEAIDPILSIDRNYEETSHRLENWVEPEKKTDYSAYEDVKYTTVSVE